MMLEQWRLVCDPADKDMESNASSSSSSHLRTTSLPRSSPELPAGASTLAVPAYVARGRAVKQQEHKRAKATEVKPHWVPYLGWLPMLCDDDRLAEVAEFIAHNYDGEFTVATSFQPNFICRLAYHGFLPMAAETLDRCVLTPKMHVNRCVLHFAELHIGRTVRRRCKHFSMSVDRRFEDVLALCNRQHADRSWLHTPLVEAFLKIHRERQHARLDRHAGEGDGDGDDDHREVDIRRRQGKVSIYSRNRSSEDTANGRTGMFNLSTSMRRSQRQLGATANAGTPTPTSANRLREENACRMHSIELWSGGELAAGEIGYAVGRMYTSLSGFSNVSSAGTVQCVALAKFLEGLGFELWDLGMMLEYKLGLGARMYTRQEFLALLRNLRDDVVPGFALSETPTRDIILPER